MTLSKALALVLRDLRARHGWTQEDLGKRLGLTQSGVSMLLNGERRDTALDFYQRVATLLGLRLSELFQLLEQTAKQRGRKARLPDVDVATLAGPLDERQIALMATALQHIAAQVTRDLARFRLQLQQLQAVEAAPPEEPEEQQA